MKFHFWVFGYKVALASCESCAISWNLLWWLNIRVIGQCWQHHVVILLLPVNTWLWNWITGFRLIWQKRSHTMMTLLHARTAYYLLPTIYYLLYTTYYILSYYILSYYILPTIYYLLYTILLSYYPTIYYILYTTYCLLLQYLNTIMYDIDCVIECVI